MARREGVGMNPTLHFDAASHRYLLAGKPVPSVTKVLAAAMNFGGVPADVLELARQRGNAVHKAVELDIADNLDEATVDERVMPYVIAWRAFRRDSGFTIIEPELRVASARYGFAGTLDLAGTFPKSRHRVAIVDTKTAVSMPVIVGPQTAGYEIGYRETRGHVGGIDRFALQLAKDASYKLVPLTRANDGAVFLSALTLWRWVDENRIEIASAGLE